MNILPPFSKSKRQYLLPKCRLISTKLHAVTIQNSVIYLCKQYGKCMTIEVFVNQGKKRMWVEHSPGRMASERLQSFYPSQCHKMFKTETPLRRAILSTSHADATVSSVSRIDVVSGPDVPRQKPSQLSVQTTSHTQVWAFCHYKSQLFHFGQLEQSLLQIQHATEPIHKDETHL
jgi:hypothetical protein